MVHIIIRHYSDKISRLCIVWLGVGFFFSLFSLQHAAVHRAANLKTSERKGSRRQIRVLFPLSGVATESLSASVHVKLT